MRSRAESDEGHSSTPPDRAAAQEATLARVAARREGHRRRPLVVRVLAAAAGGLLGLLGVAFVWWFPEVGLPLLAGGLGLLSLEFGWAARAQATVEWRATVLRRRLARLPTWVKVVALVVAIAAVAAVLLWLVT